MTRRNRCDERLVGEDPMGAIGRQLVAEQPDECDVEFACAHLLSHVHASGVADGDFDVGVALMEGGKRALHDGGGVTGVADHAEPEPARDHAGKLRQFGAGTVELVQYRDGAGKEQFACGGQTHRTAGAFEQSDAVFAFQPGDLVTERGLHDVTARGGSGEVQLLGDRDEVFELSSIHLNPR